MGNQQCMCGNKKQKIKLNKETTKLILQVFELIDKNQIDQNDQKQIIQLWRIKFNKINIFQQEADQQLTGYKNYYRREIKFEDWQNYWELVKNSGYSDQDICNELDQIVKDGSQAYIDNKKAEDLNSSPKMKPSAKKNQFDDDIQEIQLD